MPRWRLSGIFVVVTLLFTSPSVRGEEYRLGAVLREDRDAHLVAAFTFAVEWINSHRPVLGRFEYTIELVPDGDYFAAIGKACRLIQESRVLALFGSSDIHLNAQMQKLTDQLGIPFFTVVDDLTGLHNVTANPQSSAISLFPRAQLMEAMSDLIRHWRWTKVIVVYVDPLRVPRLLPFLEDPIYTSIRFHFVRVVNRDFLDAANQIEGLEDCADIHQKDCSDFSRILVDMDPNDTNDFFMAGLKKGFIELKHWFLLTSLDLRSMDMEYYRHNHARFIAANVIDPGFLASHVGTFNREKFVDYVRDAWKKHNKKDRNFRPSESALMFDAVLLATHSIDSLSKLYSLHSHPHVPRCRSTTAAPIPYHYGRRIIDHIRNTTLRGLTGDLGRIRPTSTTTNTSNFSFRIDLLGYTGNIEDVGFWEPVTDVNVNMTGDSYAALRRNVRVSDELKPHFRVTTIMERPYVMLKTNHFELGENEQFEGFCIDLLAELSRDLGFTYTIHVVYDNKYGNDVYGNGTWDGMIGEILSGQADMAVAPFTVNFRRAEVVDFTKPFLSLGISILFKIPADRQPDVFSFLNPLSFEIWLCTAGSIACLTLGMYTIARITPYEWNLNFSCCTAHQPHPAADYAMGEDTPIQMANNYSFFNTLWYVMSTMLKGGCDFGPRAVSTRWLGGTWWVFTLVIVNTYTANLAAVLTVSKPFIPIKNLDDLANQSAISYGTIKGGSTMQFFQESRIPGHMKMWNYMKDREVFVGSNRDGVERVLNENYAYLMESTSLEYEVRQNCNLTQIGGVLGSKGYGIALQKNSEWTDRISRQLLLYQKRGIIEMKKQKWWRSKGASCSGIGSSLKQQHIALNFNNISGLFLILFSGLLTSVVIVLIEFCFHARDVSRRQNTSFRSELWKEFKFAIRINNVHIRKRQQDRRQSRAPA